MGKKLYVGNLAYSVTSSDLEQLFSQFGTVQSAQVMREEEAGVYRQVTVRLTLRATIKALADFLEALEYGSMQLAIPYLQIDRRAGANTLRRAQVKARAKGQAVEEDRALSATLEVRGLAAGDEPAPGVTAEPVDSEEPGRPEQIGKAEEPAKPEQAGTPEESVKPEQLGAPEQAVKPEQTGKPEQSVKPEQSGKPEQLGAPEQPGTPEESGKPEQPGTPEQPVKPEGAGRPERSGKAEQSGEPEGAGKPERLGTPERPVKPGKPDGATGSTEPGEPQES